MIKGRIRDLRHKEKFVIDDVYLNGYARHCGINATGVYMALCRHASQKQEAFPSIKRIAEKLSISSRGLSKPPPFFSKIVYFLWVTLEHFLSTCKI